MKQIFQSYLIAAFSFVLLMPVAAANAESRLRIGETSDGTVYGEPRFGPIDNCVELPVWTEGGLEEHIAQLNADLEEQTNRLLDLANQLATCRGSACRALQDQYNQLKKDIEMTQAALRGALEMLRHLQNERIARCGPPVTH